MRKYVYRLALLMIITILFLGYVLNSAYHKSKADRITSNAEYIKNLQEASRGKQLSGEMVDRSEDSVQKGPLAWFLQQLMQLFLSDTK